VKVLERKRKERRFLVEHGNYDRKFLLRLYLKRLLSLISS
jgi:hypothetical protein